MSGGGLVFDNPCMEPVSTGAWRLVHDWTLVFRGEFYHVPAGTVTDGASIPRALWLVCGHPMEVPRLYAALVHDYLYAGGDPEATRKDADDLYRDLCIALGVAKFRAFVEWAALRAFGGGHWQGNKQQQEKENKQ